MPEPELDLLVVDRGSVTAPAGCGKTQLIADTLRRHSGEKPILILTHTRAGVAALRARLGGAEVPPSRYRLATLDGFATRLIGTFPMRSGHDPRILEIADARNDYPAIRLAASRLLAARHLAPLLRASYARLLVDEYQDCDLHQHALVDALAAVLPTIVLGDPLQAIFDFGAVRLVDWPAHVETRFPRVGVLETPWRWRNVACDALGQWLLDQRPGLGAGRGVDLATAPAAVTWIRLGAATADQQRRLAARTAIRPGETILVIGDSRLPAQRNQLARTTPGATAVDNIELSDLSGFARTFDLANADALRHFLELVASSVTQVQPGAMLDRITSIRRGRARNAATPAESAAIAFLEAPSFTAASTLLACLERQTDAHIYRPEMFHCLKAALTVAKAEAISLYDAVRRCRERHRHRGRIVSRRAVGSTLLLKGLEADVAVVLHPETMNAANLYVALTRGARRIVVCSDTPVIGIPRA